MALVGMLVVLVGVVVYVAIGWRMAKHRMPRLRSTAERRVLSYTENRLVRHADGHAVGWKRVQVTPRGSKNWESSVRTFVVQYTWLWLLLWPVVWPLERVPELVDTELKRHPRRLSPEELSKLEKDIYGEEK